MNNSLQTPLALEIFKCISPQMWRGHTHNHITPSKFKFRKRVE